MQPLPRRVAAVLDGRPRPGQRHADRPRERPARSPAPRTWRSPSPAPRATRSGPTATAARSSGRSRSATTRSRSTRRGYVDKKGEPVHRDDRDRQPERRHRLVAELRQGGEHERRHQDDQAGRDVLDDRDEPPVEGQRRLRQRRRPGHAAHLRAEPRRLDEQHQAAERSSRSTSAYSLLRRLLRVREPDQGERELHRTTSTRPTRRGRHRRPGRLPAAERDGLPAGAEPARPRRLGQQRADELRRHDHQARALHDAAAGLRRHVRRTSRT